MKFLCAFFSKVGLIMCPIVSRIFVKAFWNITANWVCLLYVIVQMEYVCTVKFYLLSRLHIFVLFHERAYSPNHHLR